MEFETILKKLTCADCKDDGENSPYHLVLMSYLKCLLKANGT